VSVIVGSPGENGIRIRDAPDPEFLDPAVSGSSDIGSDSIQIWIHCIPNKDDYCTDWVRS